MANNSVKGQASYSLSINGTPLSAWNLDEVITLESESNIAEVNNYNGNTVITQNSHGNERMLKVVIGTATSDYDLLFGLIGSLTPIQAVYTKTITVNGANKIITINLQNGAVAKVPSFYEVAIGDAKQSATEFELKFGSSTETNTTVS